MRFLSWAARRRPVHAESQDPPPALPANGEGALSRPSHGYVVCTLPRSGSNLFCDALSSTGLLGRPREYFNAAARRTYDDPNYPSDRLEQIERILTVGATPNGIYALKTFPGLHDLVAPHVRWMEVLPNLSFVRFRRRDVLGQAISWVRASQTQQFRSADPVKGETAYDGDAIAVRVRQICQRNARWDMFFARTGLPNTEVFYEDFLAEPADAVERVARSVGVTQKLAVDLGVSHFRMQRDAQSASWHQRFRDERGDPNFVDPYLDPA